MKSNEDFYCEEDIVGAMSEIMEIDNNCNSGELSKEIDDVLTVYFPESSKLKDAANELLYHHINADLFDQNIVIEILKKFFGVKRLYIRFGEIPKGERSTRGNGIIGDGYKCIGHEEGVSVWHGILLSDGYHLVAPLKANSCTHGDFSQAAFPDDCCGCNPDGKIYVVTGDEIGKGADNEPLLRNVKVIEKLPYDYFRMQEKQS